MKKAKLAELEESMGYHFKEQSLLLQAVTHSSYAHEKHRNAPYNEKLEFLGDAVISLISAEYFYLNHPDMSEGEMSTLRASLVCTASLCGYAREINLSEYLLLGVGEEQTGGRTRDSLLEDAFEAVAGAVYLDGGIDEARRFINRFLENSVENHRAGFYDYKTRLQQVVQESREETLNYLIVDQSGPPHSPTFTAEIRLNSNVIATGTGKSKKQAELEAAKQALRLLGL